MSRVDGGVIVIAIGVGMRGDNKDMFQVAGVLEEGDWSDNGDVGGCEQQQQG